MSECVLWADAVSRWWAEVPRPSAPGSGKVSRRGLVRWSDQSGFGGPRVGARVRKVEGSGREWRHVVSRCLFCSVDKRQPQRVGAPAVSAIAHNPP